MEKMGMNPESMPNHIGIQKFLKGMNYPANKMALLEQAKKNNAPANILSSLENLPDKEYRTPAELTKEMGTM